MSLVDEDKNCTTCDDKRKTSTIIDISIFTTTCNTEVMKYTTNIYKLHHLQQNSICITVKEENKLHPAFIHLYINHLYINHLYINYYQCNNLACHLQP